MYHLVLEKNAQYLEERFEEYLLATLIIWYFVVSLCILNTSHNSTKKFCVADHSIVSAKNVGLSVPNSLKLAGKFLWLIVENN